MAPLRSAATPFLIGWRARNDAWAYACRFLLSAISVADAVPFDGTGSEGREAWLVAGTTDRDTSDRTMTPAIDGDQAIQVAVGVRWAHVLLKDFIPVQEDHFVRLVRRGIGAGHGTHS